MKLCLSLHYILFLCHFYATFSAAAPEEISALTSALFDTIFMAKRLSGTGLRTSNTETSALSSPNIQFRTSIALSESTVDLLVPGKKDYWRGKDAYFQMHKEVSRRQCRLERQSSLRPHSTAAPLPQFHGLLQGPCTPAVSAYWFPSQCPQPPPGCIGFNVALQEVKVALAELTYRYCFVNATDEAIEYDPDFIVIRPVNFYARAIRRTHWPSRS